MWDLRLALDMPMQPAFASQCAPAQGLMASPCLLLQFLVASLPTYCHSISCSWPMLSAFCFFCVISPSSCPSSCWRPFTQSCSHKVHSWVHVFKEMLRNPNKRQVQQLGQHWTQLNSIPGHSSHGRAWSTTQKTPKPRSYGNKVPKGCFILHPPEMEEEM